MAGIALTLAALVAFAGNSLLCRAALAGGDIDPIGFTTIRIVAGALVLAVVATWKRTGVARAGSWWSALALLAYALAFSLSYVALDAGTGALLLFGAVQLTMIGHGLLAGERPGALEWLGLAVATAGLIGLLAPGAGAPSLLHAAMMLAAGIAWGVYSLRGRRDAVAPIRATAGNFVRAAVPALALAVAFARELSLTPFGIALAVASGAVTSGLGYVCWYAALRSHSATSAAIVQLAVPVLAALGGVALLAEPLDLRIGLAGTVTLAGVALAQLARRR